MRVPTLYYAGHTESSKYLPFRSTGAHCGFIFSFLSASAPSFNHLPIRLNWPGLTSLLFQFILFFFSRPFPDLLIKLIRRCCETRYLFARSCWLKIISFDLINLCMGLINVYRWIKINHRNKKSRETLKKNFVIGTSMRNLAFAAVAYLLFSSNIFVFFFLS